jgi:hypothetical protein
VISSEERRRQHPAGRRSAAVRWALVAVLLVVAFGVGVAVGEALHDNPRPGGSVTFVRTLPPNP